MSMYDNLKKLFVFDLEKNLTWIKIDKNSLEAILFKEKMEYNGEEVKDISVTETDLGLVVESAIVDGDDLKYYKALI